MPLWAPPPVGGVYLCRLLMWLTKPAGYLELGIISFFSSEATQQVPWGRWRLRPSTYLRVALRRWWSKRGLSGTDSLALSPACPLPSVIHPFVSIVRVSLSSWSLFSPGNHILKINFSWVKLEATNYDATMKAINKNSIKYLCENLFTIVVK